MLDGLESPYGLAELNPLLGMIEGQFQYPLPSSAHFSALGHCGWEENLMQDDPALVEIPQEVLFGDPDLIQNHPALFVSGQGLEYLDRNPFTLSIDQE
jgi:hypothetical protein